MTVKKKTKLSKKGILAVVVFVLLIILISVPVTLDYLTTKELTELGYQKEAIQTIKQNHLKDYIVSKGENETLNKVLSSSDFNINNLDIYEVITYKDQDNFTKHINLLLDKGYVKEEINRIIQTGSSSDIDLFLEKDLIENVRRYLDVSYAKLAYYDRYVSYQKEELTTNQETVTQVNIGLDKEFYVDADVITDFSIDVLANKYHQLGEDYVPDDLVEIPDEYCLNKNQQISRVALDEFIKMITDAKEEGYTIKARSSYRTYQEQEKLYNTYKDDYGEKRADEIAARPGFSEHQTGLVVDVGASEGSVFANTEEFQWLRKNAHKYGFILRYPRGKENITGYSYESWHYRYVGVEVATYIAENNITYDEYYVMFLDNK